MVLGNGHPFDSCPIKVSDLFAEGIFVKLQAYQVACLEVKRSAQLRINVAEKILTVIAKALSGRADLSVVTNIATFVAGTAR